MSERSCKSPRRQHRSPARGSLHGASVLGAVAILTGALSVLSGAVLAGPVSATAACGKGELTSSTTCYYGTSGDVDDTFTPPAGVTDVTLTADGAPGGGAASAGGDGAQVTADIPVTPLTPGYVEVGTGGGTGVVSTVEVAPVEVKVISWRLKPHSSVSRRWLSEVTVSPRGPTNCPGPEAADGIVYAKVAPV